MADFVRSGSLHEALGGIARLAQARLEIAQQIGPDVLSALGSDDLPIQWNGETLGKISCHANGNGNGVRIAAGAMGSILEYALERETAVADLAQALSANYEELNMLYSVLPNISTRVREDEIAKVLVDSAAQTLNCKRVSLLVLDKARKNLRVLASCGLPDSVINTPIPVASSIAGQALGDEDLLVVDNISERPDLAGMSRGRYDASAFVVIRVPLRARGEPLGILTATERSTGDEFTVRDCKLLEGLSSIGASALMNCRLHAAVNRQMLSTIKALACAVDAKDQYTHDHSARVATLCVSAAQELGVHTPELLRKIELAGLLHDIGKIGVPDAILSKTDKLNSQEYATVKTHVTIGADIVRNVQGLEDVAIAILHHHERFDGLGYPAGLLGEDIPIASRLIAVSDAFDSLTSDRPYRKGTHAAAAMHELSKCRGSQFDPAVLDALASLLAKGQV